MTDLTIEPTPIEDVIPVQQPPAPTDIPQPTVTPEEGRRRLREHLLFSKDDPGTNDPTIFGPLVYEGRTNAQGRYIIGSLHGKQYFRATGKATPSDLQIERGSEARTQRVYYRFMRLDDGESKLFWLEWSDEHNHWVLLEGSELLVMHLTLSQNDPRINDPTVFGPLVYEDRTDARGGYFVGTLPEKEYRPRTGKRTPSDLRIERGYDQTTQRIYYRFTRLADGIIKVFWL